MDRSASPLRRRGPGEGGIHRRADGRWEGRVDLGWHAGRRVRRSVYGNTRKEVQEQTAELLRQHNQGVLNWERSTTTGEYLTGWAQVWASRVRPKTAVFYEGIVRRHLVPVLGPIPLDKLTPLHVERAVAVTLKSGLSRHTARRVLEVLRIALNHAVRTGLVVRNVAALVQKPRVEHQELSYLTPEQSRQLLQACQDHRLGGLITLALTTGLRQGEALGLRWKDVDLDQGTIRIAHALQRRTSEGLVLTEPKTRRSRRALILPATATAALRRLREDQREDRDLAGGQWVEGDFVFTTLTGKPLDGRNVTRDFQLILKRSGLPKIRFHDLRHSAATLLLAEGVSARVVMDVLGHSQISVTLNTYSHVIPPLMKEAALAMDRVLAVDSHRRNDRGEER